MHGGGPTDLAALLEIRPGILCLTGSGGKTTLAHHLAAALPGKVIFCTTTRIYPSDTLPVLMDPTAEQLAEALDRSRAVCVGSPAPMGKLAAPSLPMAVLRDLAPYVVVEADGSKGLPMKAHLPHEPVLPPERWKTLLLVGAGGFGKPIAEAVHRPEQFAKLCGADLPTPVTAPLLARVLLAEGGFDAVVVNQASDGPAMEEAVRLAALLPVPVFAGEIRRDLLTRL